MKIVVGLGNPGEKYKKTRHNIGFMVLDKLQETQGFSDWSLKKNFQAEISEGTLNNERIILAKPQTFMNLSGKSVKSLIELCFQQEKIENLVVAHDDLDLPLGKIKIVKNRGPAGHKGVQSIIDKLGTKNFIRFRIGIKPQKIENKEQKTEKFVLQKFNKEEEKNIKDVIDKTCQAIEIAIKNGIEKAMTQFNV